MKLAKLQRTSNNYKALYEGAFLFVAFKSFCYKLLIASTTMISIHVALAFLSLAPVLNLYFVLLHTGVSCILAISYCWSQYIEMLEAKRKHINNLFN